MAELITVPTFTFSQGDVYDGAEYPIQVCYYNDTEDKLIVLNQEDRYVQFSSIKQLKKLVKEIEKHLPSAITMLDK